MKPLHAISATRQPLHVPPGTPYIRVTSVEYREDPEAVLLTYVFEGGDPPGAYNIAHEYWRQDSYQYISDVIRQQGYWVTAFSSHELLTGRVRL